METKQASATSLNSNAGVSLPVYQLQSTFLPLEGHNFP